jgi:hypothetical protein
MTPMSRYQSRKKKTWWRKIIMRKITIRSMVPVDPSSHTKTLMEERTGIKDRTNTYSCSSSKR